MRFQRRPPFLPSLGKTDAALSADRGQCRDRSAENRMRGYDRLARSLLCMFPSKTMVLASTVKLAIYSARAAKAALGEQAEIIALDQWNDVDAGQASCSTLAPQSPQDYDS